MIKTLLLLFIFALTITGCFGEKQIEYEYIYKDVDIPVKCNAVVPEKPINDGTFETHKEKMIYYLKIEGLLKECIGVKDEK